MIQPRIAFIGSAGIPNRYGGFESFVEHTAPAIVARGWTTFVTCDAKLYPERLQELRGVKLLYIGIRANGLMSPVHDLVAFFRTWCKCDAIILLGVSAGPLIPLMRILSDVKGVRLIVNIDGVEWRRGKFGPFKRRLLRIFDSLAQIFSHHIVYDNPALIGYILKCCREKASYIAYPGDHVIRISDEVIQVGTALTICRIEPENNIDLMIQAVLNSKLKKYIIIGNWNASEYGIKLRKQYSHDGRLFLLDPEYDPETVARYRERCQIYIHGHSVGGTNPSLVEMLFYDSIILCFDCEFNRETSGNFAKYFADVDALSKMINESIDQPLISRGFQSKFSADRIANAYMVATGLDYVKS